MTKFHVNKDTGEHGRCRADVKECPLGDGAEHYDSLADARAGSEKILASIHGEFSAPVQKFVRVDRVDVNEDFSHPQANRLDKVSTSVDAIANGATTSSAIAQALDIVDRQGAYYGDAAGYLGLVDAKTDGELKEYSLTPKGELFMEQDSAGREAILRETIANMPLMQVYRAEGDQSAIDFIRDTQDVGETTAERRLTTLKTWDASLDGDISSSISTDLEDGSSRFASAAEYAADQKAKRAESLKRTELRGEVCHGCFMEKALDGSCANCD